MSEGNRKAHELRCRDYISRASFRMDVIRSTIERVAVPNRPDVERELDRLRGLRNRALARAEAARLADDDAWDTIRTQLDRAIQALNFELGALESRLSCNVA